MTSVASSATPNAAEGKRRFLWLDCARGIALIAMASYHFLWDLADFGYLEHNYPSTGWPRLYARAIATTFLFLSGFSLYLAHRDGIRWRPFGKRLAMIAGAAVMVTIGTWFAIPHGFIFFGILHAIAAMSVIGLAFLRLPWFINLANAALVIALPNLYRDAMFDQPWLWWVGLSTKMRLSFDYVPIFPWFGLFLIGIASAPLFLRLSGMRQIASRKTPYSLVAGAFSYLGRHSLVFYLIHQPILISMLYLYSLAAPPGPVEPEAAYIESCETNCQRSRGEAFCRTFCACTLDRLQRRDLLAPLQSGTISSDDSERMTAIAIECTGANP